MSTVIAGARPRDAGSAMWRATEKNARSENYEDDLTTNNICL